MKKTVEKLDTKQITNGGEASLSAELPYTAVVSIKGTFPLLMHRWSIEDVETKGNAKKGSTAKKTDNVEEYVYRDDRGRIALPSEYLRMSIVGAAKFKQDPRSPRKSAYDLMKAAIFPLDELMILNGGVKTWDYLDRRRVMIQRNAITRARPAMNIGWTAQARFTCTLPEYVDPTMLNELIQLAGRVIGVGDFRPTYGRFQVTQFEVTHKG